jgi:hypothetical protein
MAVDFFQVLDLENYDLDIFNLANTEGIDMDSIGGPHFSTEVLIASLVLQICI